MFAELLALIQVSRSVRSEQPNWSAIISEREAILFSGLIPPVQFLLKTYIISFSPVDGVFCKLKQCISSLMFVYELDSKIEIPLADDGKE